MKIDVPLRPKKRKESISGMWATPVTPGLRMDLRKMNQSCDLHEMTREFLERSVAKWKGGEVA